MKSARLIIILPVAVVLFLGACDNSGKGSVNKADSTNEAKIDSGSISLNSNEADFMVEAANGGMTDVKLGELAQKSAHNQRVKDFAGMMVMDHSAAGNQLKSLASSKNITLPDSLSESSQEDLQDLSKTTGNDFDKAYMKMMLDDHQKDVKDFQDELNDVKNSDLHKWVSNTLPVLQKHLDSARAINKLYGYSPSTQTNPGADPVTVPGY